MIPRVSVETFCASRAGRGDGGGMVVGGGVVADAQDCHSAEDLVHCRSRESPLCASFPRKRESICSPRRHSGERLHDSSSRRRPGSILLLPCFGLRRCRENRLTSVCVSSTIPGRRLLSFACPKESNQRKRHPRGRGHAGFLPA